jgi:hypothetical protein
LTGKSSQFSLLLNSFGISLMKVPIIECITL